MTAIGGHLDQLVNAVVLLAPRLLASVAILLAFWGVSVALQAIVMRVGSMRRIHVDVLVMLRQTARAAALGLGVVTALGTTGINVTGLVAGLGLTGFALGFALKDILSNIVAGAVILSYRPFDNQDRVSVAGYEGLVTQIDMRYTTLRGDDDRRILVPNAAVLTNAVSVWSVERRPRPDATV